MPTSFFVKNSISIPATRANNEAITNHGYGNKSLSANLLKQYPTYKKTIAINDRKHIIRN